MFKTGHGGVHIHREGTRYAREHREALRTTEIIVYHREMTQGAGEITKGRKKLVGGAKGVVAMDLILSELW